MKQVVLPIAVFALLAFAVSWLATQFIPDFTWHHIDFKEIATGLGPALAGLACYRLFNVPNTYKLSLAGSIPSLSYGIAFLSVLLPVLLVKQTDKITYMGLVLTQFAYTLGEELGWRHYLQNATSRFTKWQQALLIGLIWFVWHYSILPDPTTMLTGKAMPPYIGIPMLLLLLVLLSKLFSDVVIRTQACLLPTIIHYVGKVGSGYTLIIVYVLVFVACLSWHKIRIKGQSLS